MTARSVLVLSTDPYLVFLLERHPDGLEVVVGDNQMRISSVLDAGTDLVVCEHDDPRRAELAQALQDGLLVVGPPAEDGQREVGVIHRPLSADEVQRAVEQPGRERPVDLADPIGRLAIAYPWALVFSGVVAALVLHLRLEAFAVVATGYAVVAYGLVRTRLRARAWLALDVAIATTAAVAVHGTHGAFVVLSLAVAAGTGLHLPALAVLPATLAIGGANAYGAHTSAGGGIELIEALQTVLTFPLVGLLALVGRQRAGSARAVQEAERLGQLLRELRILAGSEPDALRLSRVVRTGLQDVCTAAQAPAGVLLLFQDDRLRVAAAEGVDIRVDTEVEWPGDGPPTTAACEALPAGDLPAELGPLAGVAETSTVLTARGHHHVEALFVLAGAVRRGQRDVVTRAADRIGTSIANARLFARLRTDTVDEERRRLAGELHDSTAQVLAHIRLELELLARRDDEHAEELRRLARVSQRAQEDIREVINGLRASIEDQGLVGSLRAYVADVRSQSGPVLWFEGHMEHYHPPEVEREVFRVAQEAISNAVRHSGGTRVDVSLTSQATGIVLVVDDDGHGLERSPAPSRGLGMDQMRERADLVGGTLDVVSSGSGTRVVLRVPAHTRWAAPQPFRAERSMDA